LRHVFVLQQLVERHAVFRRVAVFGFIVSFVLPVFFLVIDVEWFG
jgi:hypothetical protein